MWVTDAQVKKMRRELDKDNNVTRAAMKAGMDRKTARRYRDLGELPSEARGGERTWRTRADPFDEDWPAIELMLRDAPALDVKTVFDDLVARRPGVFQPGQLRTLQRRVKRWRGQQGPEKEIYFAQEHRAGEAMQTDFTVCDDLLITLAGSEFPHMLCHSVLPYSNWQWATVCFSESMTALKRGVQRAFKELGGLTEFHQTDNSTAATHEIGNGKRGFNGEYQRWMEHLNVKPRTIAVGKSEQNGDVESLNGALKRRLTQHLLLRGSRDFATKEDYTAFVHMILRRTNLTRGERLAAERAVLRPLPEVWFPEYSEAEVWVTPWSTIRVDHNTYSVPSRLIHERTRVRIFDEEIEVWFEGTRQLVMPRLHGRNGHRIDYRHVVWSLVKKPRAFARYRYREDLFPSLTFRRAYDALSARHVERVADLEYVRLLHLAASTVEADVEIALQLALDTGVSPVADTIRGLVRPTPQAVPALVQIGEPSLASYDRLITAVGR
jgi:hypothetical protein